MKNARFARWLFVALFSATNAAALAAEATGALQVRSIQVSTGASGTAAFYFMRTTNPSGWGAPSCPGAVYVYFDSGRVGAKEALANVMLAKQLGSNVQFHGDCNGQSYFSATTVVTAP